MLDLDNVHGSVQGRGGKLRIPNRELGGLSFGSFGELPRLW
jgi:hypothetical protein